MGILNVTPDSFFDGGEFNDVDRALRHAAAMIAAGVDIIDIGGESTRPGAAPVTAAREIQRVLPVVAALRAESDVAVSIDTSKPEVMAAALCEDIDLVNDVMALQAPGALDVMAAGSLPVCLMHMQGEPRTMQKNPVYTDVVEDVATFFTDRIKACQAAGISADRLVLDIGFGFGKTPEHNLQLINRLQRFTEFGMPLLVGLSRKSTIGLITGDRLTGSISGALAAVSRGARIIRVHDVGQTVAALSVWQSIAQEKPVDWQ